MAERGFAGTSISAIAERSGLLAGSIYWHFESKEALLAAVVEEGARRWFEALPEPGRPGSEPGAVKAKRETDRLRRARSRRSDQPGAALGGDARGSFLEAAAASLEERPEFLRLLLLIALERREADPRSLESIRRVRAMARERLRRLLLPLVEPLGQKRAAEVSDAFAALALAAADGAFVAHHIDREGAPIGPVLGLLRRALEALARELASSGRR